MGLFLPGTSEKALPNIVHPWYKQLSGQLPAHFLKLAEWQQTERCDRLSKAASLAMQKNVQLQLNNAKTMLLESNDRFQTVPITIHTMSCQMNE